MFYSSLYEVSPVFRGEWLCDVTMDDDFAENGVFFEAVIFLLGVLYGDEVRNRLPITTDTDRLTTFNLEQELGELCLSRVDVYGLHVH